jgi:hypothetical protein
MNPTCRAVLPAITAVVACASFASSAGAQERNLPVWGLVNSGGPAPRHSHGMVYDGARGVVVMFGGRSGQSAFDGTWLHDGAAWTWAGPVHHPSARYDATMAYDSRRQRVVLFGGADTGYLGDTWEWDGVDWTQMHPAQSPQPRRLHAMTYDAARGETVLFGGSLGAPGTWIWNGTNWSLRAVADPGSREGTAIVYSPNSHRVLLFGGNLAGQLQNDLWQWDGSSWAQLHQAVSPSPRCYRLLGGVLMFGGFSADTWLWNGAWQQLSTPGGPRSRAQSRLAHMESRRRTILFGGIENTYPNPSPFGDTWSTTFAGTQVPFGSGCGAVALTLVPATGGARTGGVYTPRVLGVPTSPGAAFLSLGVSRLEAAGAPLPRALDPFGLPGCSLYQDMALAFAIAGQPTTAGQAQFVVPIPALVELAGLVVFAQVWAPDPSANAAGLVTSNAMAVGIGG